MRDMDGGQVEEDGETETMSEGMSDVMLEILSEGNSEVMSQVVSGGMPEGMLEGMSEVMTEKEAEHRFLAWYQDVSEERMAMLEAEEAYKRRVKELERGLADLLYGFEQAEKEVQYLRNKYEPERTGGGQYNESYKVVSRERDNLREEVRRDRKVIERLESENASLRDRVEVAGSAGLTLASLSSEPLPDLDTSPATSPETNPARPPLSHPSPGTQAPVASSSPETEVARVPPQYPEGSNVMELYQVNGLMQKSPVNNGIRVKFAFESNKNDNTIGENSVEAKEIDSGVTVYTRKTIMNYRKEVQSLLTEKTNINRKASQVHLLNMNGTKKLQLENRKNVRTRNNFSVPTTGMNRLKISPARNSSSQKCPPNKPQIFSLSDFPEGLVVIASASRLQRLEEENKKLSAKLWDLELAHQELSGRHSQGGARSQPAGGRGTVSRFPRLPQTDRSPRERQEPWRSSSTGSPAAASKDSRQTRNLYKSSSIISYGYLTMYNARR